MRFIIHEMAYEKPLTAGKWQYQLDDQATGAVEEWRLTEAREGYRFLRVDLDARRAASGRSTIYHLTLDENGEAAQLKYRFWAGGLELIGNVLLEEDAVIVTRETISGRQEDVIAMPRGYAFWFPATAALGLLAGNVGTEKRAALMLRTTSDDPPELMRPVRTLVSVAEGAPAQVTVMGEMKLARRIRIRWEDQTRNLWVDETGWPLRMARDDGLTAVLARQIIYQQIIKPGVTKAVDTAGTSTDVGQEK